MPKKTRKEKIIAELRRKLRSQENILLKTSSKVKERPQIATYDLPKETLIKTKVPVKKGKISTLNYDYSFVVYDLKKTLYIGLLAIILELVLYYVLELNGGNKIFPIISKFLKIF